MERRFSKHLILLICVIISVASIVSIASARPAEGTGDSGRNSFNEALAYVRDSMNKIISAAKNGQTVGAKIDGPDGCPFKTLDDIYPNMQEGCINVYGNPSGAFQPVQTDVIN